MKLDTFTNLRRIYRTITLFNIPDLKPSLYRPIGNYDIIIFKKLVLKILKGSTSKERVLQLIFIKLEINRWASGHNYHI